MKMRISDVAKILDLPLETLRFYERNNVVAPFRDENNYRYYDTWDVFQIIELMQFRNIGFSVKEATEAMHRQRAEMIVESFDRMAEKIRRTMVYDQMMLNHLERHMSELKTIEKNVGLFRYEMRSEHKGIFFSKEEDEEYPGMDPGNSEITKWLKGVPFTKGAKHIHVDDSLNITESDTWSFLIDERYVDYFGLADSKNVFTIPQGLYLTTYVSAGSRGNIGDGIFDPVIAYIRENDIKVCGDILSIIVLKCHDDEGNMQRFMKVAVPVEG